MHISYKVTKVADTVTSQLRGMEKALGYQGRTNILTGMANRFVEMSKATFGTGGNTLFRGNVWPLYSKKYAKKVGTFIPSLYRTGKLKASIQYMTPYNNSVLVYCNHPRADIHFFGGKKMPARRFMPIEGNGMTSWRLTFMAERVMNTEIENRIRLLSGIHSY